MAVLKVENTKQMILDINPFIRDRNYLFCLLLNGTWSAYLLFSPQFTACNLTWSDLLRVWRDKFCYSEMDTEWPEINNFCECSSFCSISIQHNCSETNVCRILPATTRERVSTRVSKLHHIAYDPNNPNRQYQSHSLLILGPGGSMGPSVLSYPKWVVCSIPSKAWVCYLKKFYL